VGEHDPTRFLSGGANYLTADEEASGVLDMQAILGPGMFLTVDQAHYGIAGELVEGGQLLAFYNPDSYNSNPEIALSGNNVTILDGDVTPSTIDNTDFGKAESTTPVSKTFTIQNNGIGKLVVKSITISGVNATDFTLVNAPVLPLTIDGGKTLDITVKFSPLSTDTRTAVLNIGSNDLDETNYDIALQGTGIAPEINIQGSGLNIVDGDITPTTVDNTDFGVVQKATSTLKAFVIQNLGTADLKILAINITGNNASEFLKVNAPALPLTIPSGGSQAVIIQFAPQDIGFKTAVLNIASNDANEGSYDFALQGKASQNTGIDATGIFANEITLYPNPSDGIATIEFNSENSSTVNITVTDMLGKDVLSPVAVETGQGKQTISMNTSGLVSGIYFVKVTSNGQSKTIKVSVIH
ncbi:MAG: choice-of-anchor D domain-containing protein, partial [Bacteroidia bacterium]|nr:choice-of-anchor D domain-containing protein [Bacteroidia bacterium]